MLRFFRGRVIEWLYRGRATTAAELAEPTQFSKQSGTVETENSFAHLVASLTFHPKPYAGNVTLIWGTDQPTDRGDPTIGWDRLARSVRIVPMTGGHVAPLRGRIDELGGVLATLLSAGARPFEESSE
jgi:hypothetical protein